MNRLSLLAFAFVAFSPLAQGIDAVGTFVVLGVGGESCGKFVEERREKRDNVYRGWVTGYLTAKNHDMAQTHNILGSTDMDGAMLWLENYCSKNPLMSVSTATEALVVELKPTRKQKR